MSKDPRFIVSFSGLCRIDLREMEFKMRFARMLLVEMPTLYGPFASNLIISSTIDFINALLLERHTKDMQVLFLFFSFFFVVWRK